MSTPRPIPNDLLRPAHQGGRKLYIELQSQFNGLPATLDGKEDIQEKTLGVLNEIHKTITVDNLNSKEKTLLNDFSEEVKIAFNKVGLSDIHDFSEMPKTTTAINKDAEDKRNSKIFIAVDNSINETSNLTPTRPFIRTTNDSDINLGQVRYKKLGEHLPKKLGGAEAVDQANTLSIRDMKKMGLLMMLKATGDFTNINLENVSEIEAPSLIAAATLAPGIARLGGKVAVNRFLPKTVMTGIKSDFKSPSHDGLNKELSGKTLLSYGNTNSPFVQFEGITSVSSITSATLLIATVAGLLKSLTLLKFVTKEKELPMQPSGSPKERARWLGSYEGKADETESLIDLNIVNTQHSFFDCLDVGITEFFNLQDQGSFLASAGNAVKKLAQLHGYYNVVLRAIIRNITDLVTPIAEAGGANQGENFKPELTSTLSAVDPFTIVSKLNRSPLINFINTLAIIGDKKLSLHGSEDNTLSLSDIDDIGDSIKVSFTTDTEVGKQVLNPAILQAKVRLNNGQLGMAESNIRSLYLLPESLLRASEALGTTRIDKVAGALAGTNQVISNPSDMEIGNGRIKQELVEKMEEYLERAYVPFYFHDIRTNEILSFHAFLGPINESIDAEYNSSDVYGRIGQIHTYKNTNRTLSFEFKTVATSEADFDDMWYKLNRLAMMLYPQWTEGRRVSFGNNKFIQPFSQQIGASPLVRVRIGDLIKGNYSKLAAARMFGLSDGIGPGEINAFNLTNWRQASAATRESIATARSFADRIDRTFEDQRNGRFRPGETIRIKSTTGRRPYQRFNLLGTSERGPGLTTHSELVATVQRIERNHIVIGALRGFPSQEPYNPATTSRPGERLNPTAATQYMIDPRNDVIPDRNLIEQDLRARPRTELNNTDSTSATNNQNALVDFFDSNLNPIIRSFESTKGKGLPGFIKGMTMDYSEATWVTDRGNARAPLLVKINMTFLPIYDIQPGLDSNGFMTAPIWNVGNTVGQMGEYDNLQTTMSNILNARSSLIR
jgi:hypothetical protein